MSIVQREAAKAAIASMLAQSHFSICVIDRILAMTGAVPPRREYDVLHALHCVDYKDMSPRLRIELPRLLQVVLESQPVRAPELWMEPGEVTVIKEIQE